MKGYIRYIVQKRLDEDLTNFLHDYSKRIRAWLQRSSTILKSSYTAAADLYRAQLETTLSVGTEDDQELEQDLHRLRDQNVSH
jgi:hypothetical protein